MCGLLGNEFAGFFVIALPAILLLRGNDEDLLHRGAQSHSVVRGATMETARSLSGLARRTKQGRTLATIPKSTSAMSPSSGKFVIQDFRGRA
jgi:hypothetical protein